PDQGRDRPGARDLRERRSVADTGSGRSARGGAQEAWQAVRVPSLRRRWPRVLLLPPPGVSRGASVGRMGEDLRVLRQEPRSEVMCTNIATTARISGSAKTPRGWVPVHEATLGFDHATHLWTEHAVRIDFTDGSPDGAAVELDLASARALRERLDEV